LSTISDSRLCPVIRGYQILPRRRSVCRLGAASFKSASDLPTSGWCVIRSESRWLASGVPMPAECARLGHSDMQTTLRIYGHLIHGQDDEAVRKWEEYQQQNRPAGADQDAAIANDVPKDLLRRHHKS
jgi:hypothetical protein